MKIEPHALLDAAVFRTTFPKSMAEIDAPDWLVTLRQEGSTKFTSSDEIRKQVRDLFRVAGYKPTGRGKPASEYLVKAAAEGGLSPINAAVDVCNIVSLGSGLPISVVDADKAEEPLCVKIAGEDGTYVFNPSGQEIRFPGLFCLYDNRGPCANGVKDSQRTKTGPETHRTVTVIWGTTALPGRTAEVLEWYREMLQRLGAEVELLKP